MNTPYIESNCVFEHEGRAFEAGGAVATDNYIIAYPGDDGILNDWHGRPLGRWWIVSSWPVQSFTGSTMHQIEARVNGVTYTGRGFGKGVIYKGKRKAKQR